ncbi:acyl-CoA N-acyltransferase [Flammula alnicola]|nr:acyl-CoA N-acyltransferase [Flammula alnicola]
MTPNQLHPLEINLQTQESFLRLRKHKNIILTPMRWEDAPHYVPLLNDPRVYDWLSSSPFPYALKDAEEWIQLQKPQVDGYLQDLRDAQGSETLKTANGAPICSIREVKEDGTDMFIGTISLCRCDSGELMNTDSVDFDHAEQNTTENNKLEVGDPNIVWSIGDYLAPSHHGRGIMTDAVDTLVHDWAVPRMGVRRILSSAFVGNHGSVKVFEKNGFTLVRTIENHSVVRGKMRGMHVFEWELAECL